MKLKITYAGARHNKGYSRGLAAEMLGISASTLFNYEKGITPTPDNIIKRMSKIYDVPMIYFFSTESTEKPCNINYVKVVQALTSLKEIHKEHESEIDSAIETINNSIKEV